MNKSAAESSAMKAKLGDTLYRRVRNEILKMIIERRITPNEMLPSEGEIAEWCGVSKMTSKLALNSLANDNIIYRIPRKGSFLADVDLNQIRNMVEMNTISNSYGTRTNYFALVIPKLDAYCANIVREILRAAANYGYHVVVKYTDGLTENEEQALADLSRIPEIRGIILFPGDSNTCGIELLNCKVRNYPIVMVDRVYKEIAFDSIYHDHYQGAKDAVGYLIQRGHSKIGFISNAVANVTSREERYQGYMAGMMEANKRIRNESVAIDDRMLQIESLKDYLIRNEGVTAVFCADDYIAVNLYYAAQELGKKIPDDLSIIGFTDNDILKYIPLRMTTVRQPVEDLCIRAVEVLMNKIADSNSPAKTIRIKTEIIERDSVKEI